jgi:nitrite reductase (cytochrome c-552)
MGQGLPEALRVYKKSIDMQRTKARRQRAVPQTPSKADPRSVVARSKVEEDAGLKAMWQGYAFSEDFREERGHYYMLEDQRLTKRQVVVKQPGACVNCHASMYLAYKKAGNGDIVKGFDKINAMPYQEASKLVTIRRLHRLPRRQDARAARHPARVHRRHARLQGLAGRQGLRRQQARLDRGNARLRLRPVPRRVLLQGSREEPRLSLVEGPADRADPPPTTTRSASATGLTRTPALPPSRRSIPSSRTWSQGTHARAGVTCVDCHMPALSKTFTDHWVRSPI